MGKLLLSHRSTNYPCFVPNLGDSSGAGRKRLTHGKGRELKGYFQVLQQWNTMLGILLLRFSELAEEKNERRFAWKVFANEF